MRTLHNSWTVVGCAVLVTATLLACKKKSTESSSTSTTSGGTETTPTATAAPPPPPKLHNVGETAEGPAYKLTVENVKECKPGPWDSRLKEAIYLGVEITLEATGDKQVFPSPFKVVAGDGTVLESAYMSGKSCDPRMGFQTLSKGEKIKGWFIVKAPTSATKLKFTYEPISYPPEPPTKFDLGR